ncbi:MAG TPA: outer membrane beta-barrel protein [Hyphomonas sp.]|nr:outer membrane beta-barrel protein [Hyphomonas sp.]MCB9960658.1 outer membrane beta-barrel protein [Hyphomonas sp.]HPE47198.1 outer membrane beta-barrel protein [Hyphomonas sp.]
MNNFKRLSLLSVATCGLAAAPALAQTGNNYYSRDKYEAVMDRRQPEFDPEPIRLGAFLVDATGVVGATSTSNAYATPNNEQSDVIARIGTTIHARTNWSVHEVGADVSAYRNEYLDLSDESFNDIRASLRGRLDVTRDFSVGGRAFVEDRVEQRTDPANSVGLISPVKFNRTGVEGQATYWNDRFRWNSSVSIADVNYKDGVQAGTNAVVDQDYRDRTDTFGFSRLSYAVSPNLAVFGQATVNKQDYKNAELIGGSLRKRDSDGYTVAGGVDFELTSLIRGDIAVGYMSENKKDNFFKDVDGLSIDGQMQWFPSRLTTVSFNANRRVVDVGSFESPSAIATNFRAQVDHELYRNIVLSGYGGTTKYDYQEIDRSDDVLDFGVSGIYKLNKRVHVEGFLRHLNRDVSGSAVLFDQNYDVNLIGVELRLHP